jgi:hypothetical protein
MTLARFVFVNGLSISTIQPSVEGQGNDLRFEINRQVKETTAIRMTALAMI